MDLDALRQLDPPALRQVLPPFLAGYIADPTAARHNRERVGALLQGWSDPDLQALVDALATIGSEQRVYFADPSARQLSRVWTRDVVTEAKLDGVEHLVRARAAGPTVLACNHLSYIDSTAIDTLLAWAGYPDIADKLVSVAGPKVYSDLFRRVSSATLNTLPVPQSASVGDGEALSRRELMGQTLQSLAEVRELVAAGWVPLFYPEGSRSRSIRLQPFLKGVYRYLETARTAVVPGALTGTERVMAVGAERLTPGPVSLRCGPPIDVEKVGGARAAVTAVHEAISQLLPDSHRPEPGTPAVT